VLLARSPFGWDQTSIEEMEIMERARVTLGRIGPGLFLPSGVAGRSVARSADANADVDAPREMSLSAATEETIEV
jgi:hypothetical protein